MDSRSIRDVLCRVAVLVVLFALPSVAEAARPVGAVPPVADFVTLELKLLAGEAVTVTVREGRLATFAHEELGYRVGIVPRVVDRESGTVELELVEVEGKGAAAKIDRRLDLLRGQKGFRTVTAAAAALPLDVRVIEVGPRVGGQRSACATTPSSGRLASSSGLVVEGPDEEDAMRRIDHHTAGCCVYCYGYETCGCSVSTPCGTCNDPEC